jgi:hypothetical protein
MHADYGRILTNSRPVAQVSSLGPEAPDGLALDGLLQPTVPRDQWAYYRLRSITLRTWNTEQMPSRQHTYLFPISTRFSSGRPRQPIFGLHLPPGNADDSAAGLRSAVTALSEHACVALCAGL